MTFSQKLGFVSCVIIIVSLFLNWAWYPDIQKYFTAFFTQGNHYGRPGIWFAFVSITGIIFYWVNKAWSQRLNLILSGLSFAYAIRTILLFTSAYDGYVPTAKAGIYLMLLGSLGHVIASGSALAVVKRSIEEPLAQVPSEINTETV
jgi:hypothetical protein